MRHPKASEAGFTLVELLVSMTIMAVGLLALAEMQVVAIKTNAYSSDLFAMNALAQNAIEKIAALSSDDPLPKPPYVAEASNVVLPGFENVEVVGAGTFQVLYSTESAGIDFVSRVKIRVQNVSGASGRRPVTMTTLKRWRA